MRFILIFVAGFLVSCTSTQKKEEVQNPQRPPLLVWQATPGATVQFPVGVNISAAEVSKKSDLSEVKMVWDSNTEGNTAGYRVYLGTEKGKYSQFIDIGKGAENSKTQSFKILGLAPGKKYYFAVSAYNEQGVEGPLSSEVEKQIPAAKKIKSADKKSVEQNRAQ